MEERDGKKEKNQEPGNKLWFHKRPEGGDMLQNTILAKKNKEVENVSTRSHLRQRSFSKCFKAFSKHI